MSDKNKESPDILAAREHYLKFGNLFQGILDDEKMKQENVIHVCAVIKRTISDFLDCAYGIDEDAQVKLDALIGSSKEELKSGVVH